VAEEKLSQGSIDDLIAQLLAGGAGSGTGDGPAFGDDGPVLGDDGPTNVPEADAA
jgi:hypothetical protein